MNLRPPRAVEVAVDPLTAFTAFTEEIDCWWVRGPINFFDSARAVAMRIEPGVGGRVLEIYDEDAGDALELGRITTWQPGSRLTYRCSVDDTEVDVRFEAVGTVPLILYRLDGPPPQDRPVTHMTWVHVDDLDAHCAHARANGATIVSEIRQHGYRGYVAEDLDGHRWTFAQARPTMHDGPSA